MAKFTNSMKKGMNKFGDLLTVNTYVEMGVVVALILYIAGFMHMLENDFFILFENTFVKVLMLVFIGVVGLYSPAVSLFLAIAFICTLQTAQRRRIMNSMGIKDQDGAVAEKMMNNEEDDMMNNDELAMKMTEEEDMIKGVSDVSEMGQELGENEGFYVKNSDMNNVSGYNLDAQCYDKNGQPDLQCNQVMTYNNSCSAQGLGTSSSCPIPGLQDSVGAPFDCNN